MASDSGAGGAQFRMLVRLLRQPRAAVAARGFLAAIIALALAGPLVFFFLKTDSSEAVKRMEVLGHLRALKSIDASWDGEVLRARSANPTAAGEAVAPGAHGQALAALAQQLTSPALGQGLPELTQFFGEKADLVTKYGKASEETRQAFKRVMDADTEISALVRGSWRDFPDRERLVAVENVVTQLLAEAQAYYFSPNPEQRKQVDMLIADLRDALPRMPPALNAGLVRLDEKVQLLFSARAPEQALLDRLHSHAAGSRADDLSQRFQRETEEALVEQGRYRIYFMAYAAVLLALIAFLAWRLIAALGPRTEPPLAPEPNAAEPPPLPAQPPPTAAESADTADRGR